MRLTGLLLFSMLLIQYSCTNNNNNNNAPDVSNTNIRVSPVRTVPKKDPIATYLIPMGDPKLERKFGVSVFETPYTFKFLLNMEYDGMIQTDTLRVPDLGEQPTIVVKPGKEKMTCIIGFLDNKKVFRPYKLLTAANDQLKLKVLNSYVITEN